MNLYLIGIILFIIVLIVCILLYIYFNKDEKNLVEVSNKELISYGKSYTKEEFENTMFEIYSNVLSNIQYENYSYLKDIVSDEIYNQILLDIKTNKENNTKNIISNITKEFSKLISFEIRNDLEIAKLWIKYSDIEYTKGNRQTQDEEGNIIQEEVVIKGDANKKINHEYILTFVKNRSDTEDIICPNCGYQTHILTNSKCIRCDSEIVPKKMHWVYVGKVSTNISNNK